MSEHQTIIKRLRMVLSNNHSRLSGFIGGLCGMEIAVLLLLLIVPLTTASPLRPLHRADTDVVLQVDAVQTSEAESSENTQEEQHTRAVKIIPFHSESKRVDLDALKHRMALKLRPRRASPRGCQLGTCQIHNLATTLYHISKTKDKEQSKGASDPQGFGR